MELGLKDLRVLVTAGAAGIGLFQGYWFARPAFEALPALSPEAVRAAA